MLDAQLAGGELPPETAAALEQMRSELWLADAAHKVGGHAAGGVQGRPALGPMSPRAPCAADPGISTCLLLCRAQDRQALPSDFLRKKRQRGHEAADRVGGEREPPVLAAPVAAADGAPPSPRSDAGSSDNGGSSSGISWRSGSTGGSSLPHHLSGMAATDILDSYMRELLHNTIPCLGAPLLGGGGGEGARPRAARRAGLGRGRRLPYRPSSPGPPPPARPSSPAPRPPPALPPRAADAVLGLYSDAQAECAARLLPEDRLGEARVEQMVRRRPRACA